MDVFQICKQCGEAKPSTDANYRQYYAGRKGRYKICRTCERINTRYKYLISKGALGTAESEEQHKIESMYTLLEARNLQIPTFVHRTSGFSSEATTTARLNDVDRILSMSQAVISHDENDDDVLLTVQPTNTATDDLTKWLLAELDPYSPEELYEIFDQLRDTYRPVTGYNELAPIYDNTHKDTLDAILERFDEYEVRYYNGK